jgi:hypothetical protein
MVQPYPPLPPCDRAWLLPHPATRAAATQLSTRQQGGSWIWPVCHTSGDGCAARAGGGTYVGTSHCHCRGADGRQRQVVYFSASKYFDVKARNCNSHPFSSVNPHQDWYLRTEPRLTEHALPSPKSLLVVVRAAGSHGRPDRESVPEAGCHLAGWAGVQALQAEAGQGASRDSRPCCCCQPLPRRVPVRAGHSPAKSALLPAPVRRICGGTRMLALASRCAAFAARGPLRARWS